MGFSGWRPEDFAAMQVAGFTERMQAIRERVRPKLESVAAALAPELSQVAGEALFAHVAQHARRTVNPPNQTWCAWSASPRGYKKQPHFQLGLWDDHVFVQVGAIWEAPFRSQLADLLAREADSLRRAVPIACYWTDDHTDRDGVLGRELTPGRLAEFTAGLRRRSKGDLMVGMRLPREQALALSGEAFLKWAARALAALVPVYRVAREAERAQAVTSRVVPIRR